MSASEAAAATQPAGADAASQRAELDVEKLHALPSEQQDLYLLTFTADLVQHTVSLDTEKLAAQQSYIKQELFKILQLTSPVPSRVIRNNIGRCFGAVFSKGNRVILFDTVAELIVILSGSKSGVDLKTKFAATVVLGDIYAAAGDGAVTQFNSACVALLKLLKSAQNNAGLRSSIFTALRKVVAGAGNACDEATVRDIWKHARNVAVSDKANTAQAAACMCLQQLVKTTPYFGNMNDYESLKNTIWKVIDSPVTSVRHAAASCLAAFLVKSYSTVPMIASKGSIRRPKKQTKRQSAVKVDDEGAMERAESPSRHKSEKSLSFKLTELLLQLSLQYCKSSTGNRARAAIAICYELVFKGLGEKTVEECYPQIVNHLLVHLLNHPTVTNNRYRLLITRKFVKHILEVVVGQEMLRETSQLNAAKWLINDLLKDYPQVVQERQEPNKYTLISALSALSSLLDSLGPIVETLAESCREALVQVLQHPSFTVQVHIAHCMRSFVLACPQQLLLCVTICMNTLNRELGQLSTPRQSSRRCLGYAHGLAAMLSTSRLQPLYGSVDVYGQVLSKATDLLKTSGNSELRIASTQIQVAWILIGGLMPLGPNFTKIHLPQLMLLWKNALPKPLTKSNLAQRGPLEMSFLAHVRECALGSILVFLEFNSKLVTSDGSKRIATMLQNTISFLDNLPRRKSVEDISQRLSPSLQLTDFTTMVRRRVLQCFTQLVNLNHQNLTDTLPLSSMLGFAISCFADPDVISANPFDASIATPTANFESLWGLDDNFGFGVTGLVREFSGQYAHQTHRTSNVINAMGGSIDGEVRINARSSTIASANILS